MTGTNGLAYGEGPPSPYIEAAGRWPVRLCGRNTGRVPPPPTLKRYPRSTALVLVRAYGEGPPSPYIEAAERVGLVPVFPSGYGEGPPSPYIEARSRWRLGGSRPDTGRVPPPPTLKRLGLEVRELPGEHTGRVPPPPTLKRCLASSATQRARYGEGPPSPYIEATLANRSATGASRIRGGSPLPLH